MTSITATQARKDFYNLVAQLKDSHEPVQITSKRGNGILISEEDWLAIQETLHLQSIPGMRESIIEGMADDVENCSEDLPW